MWMHTLGHVLHKYFVKDIKIIQMKTLSLRRWIFMELSQILMWWLTVIIVKATLSLKYVFGGHFWLLIQAARADVLITLVSLSSCWYFPLIILFRLQYVRAGRILDFQFLKFGNFKNIWEFQCQLHINEGGEVRFSGADYCKGFLALPIFWKGDSKIPRVQFANGHCSCFPMREGIGD